MNKMKLLVFFVLTAGAASLAQDSQKVAAQLQACSKDNALAESLVQSVSNCNCNTSELNRIQGASRGMSMALLHERIIRQSLYNTLDRFYVLSRRHLNEDPIDTFVSICEKCSQETENIMNQHFSKIDDALGAHRKILPLSNEEAATALNAQVKSLNKTLGSYNEAKGYSDVYKGESALKKTEEANKSYLQYVNSFYNDNSGLLATPTSQEKIYEIRAREYSNAYKLFFMNRKYYHRENVIQADDIPQMVKEARGKMIGEVKALSTMLTHASTPALVARDLTELVQTHPVAIGQVLAANPELTSLLCFPLEEAKQKMTENEFQLTKLMIAGAAGGVIMLASPLALASATTVAIAGAGAMMSSVAGYKQYKVAQRLAKDADKRELALMSGNADSRVADEAIKMSDLAHEQKIQAYLQGVGFVAGDALQIAKAAKPMLALKDTKAAAAFLSRLNKIVDFIKSRPSFLLIFRTRIGPNEVPEFINTLARHGDEEVMVAFMDKVRDLAESSDPKKRQRLKKLMDEVKKLARDC